VDDGRRSSREARLGEDGTKTTDRWGRPGNNAVPGTALLAWLTYASQTGKNVRQAYFKAPGGLGPTVGAQLIAATGVSQAVQRLLLDLSDPLTGQTISI
ncbi:uncharacterized protein METZ01_LOCUS477894, partial [marine metagenome]